MLLTALTHEYKLIQTMFFVWCGYVYKEIMNNLFNNIPLTIPEPKNYNFKIKQQALLEDIGVKLVCQ